MYTTKQSALYLGLILVRLYFTLSPSYLHPDENFQGPEVIAGLVFGYPTRLTWEFTSEHPIRSIFPLWLFYGLPMLLLRWLWDGVAQDEVPPAVVYWTLRVLMLALSFVLEDWAVLELVQSLGQQHIAVFLVASSYVTWTYQTHTFSNSIETLIVAWSLILVTRIIGKKWHSSIVASAIFAFISVLGVFNRISFAAFLVVPGVQLLPHFRRKPLSLLSMFVFGILTAAFAVAFDTVFYTKSPVNVSTLIRDPVLTPYNNFKYNSNFNNLAQHGVHQFYQHIFVNLPQLLGPAYPLLLFWSRKTARLATAVISIMFLSLFPHQEARFLIPTIPLILSSVRLPTRHIRSWIAAWALFNVFMGILMGLYHQGGVIPAQLFITENNHNATHVIWWKTYSPPVWLLKGKSEQIDTIDLMGILGEDMIDQLLTVVSCSQNGTSGSTHNVAYLVAPHSATFLDQYTKPKMDTDLILDEVWTYKFHLSLDDMNISDEGLWRTLHNVLGRMGLSIWIPKKTCAVNQN